MTRRLGGPWVGLWAATLAGCVVEIPGPKPEIDEDGDGSPVADDCDDAAPEVHPGASETCNGIDDDCDGQADLDAVDRVVLYLDADGDGAGAGGATIRCPEAGYVATDGDCDDADPAVSPDAAEVCGGADENCDGDLDEDALDALTWYTDADGDGQGDPDRSRTGCAAEPDEVATATDCDDLEASVGVGMPETCNARDDDCDAAVDEEAIDAPTWYADTDADTFGDDAASTVTCEPPADHVSTGGDCAPADPAQHPGADERCNGSDDDCDGVVDEPDAIDTATWYADADADGAGNPAVAVTACTAPNGHVAPADDCDDARNDVLPGAPESCDGVDHDCDGAVNEPESIDATPWYADVDGDGFGDPAVSTIACTAPADYVADASDCDDGDAAVHPGAEERCNGVDDDCDGAAEGVHGVDEATWYADYDGDGYGNAALTTEACAAPALTVADASDCDDTDPDVSPEGTESCDGVDEDCDGTVDDAVADAPTWYGDGDRDGYGDPDDPTVACEAPADAVANGSDCDDTDSDVHPAAVEVCDNGEDDDCDGLGCLAGVRALADAVGFDGPDAEDHLGYRLAGGGDLTGDGTYDDALLSAFFDSVVGNKAGAAWVVPGSSAPASATLSSANAWKLSGEAAEDQAGIWVDSCDVTGDGAIDVLVGAHLNDARVTDGGAVYVVTGPVAEDRALADADLIVRGTETEGSLGWAFGCLQDGNGVAALAVGAFTTDDGAATDAGTVWLWDTVGATGELDGASRELLAEIRGDASLDNFGYRVIGGPDLDGDGSSELVVGAQQADGAGGTLGNAGAVYVFLTQPAGRISAGDADILLTGGTGGGNLGVALANARDVDGDSYEDLLIGAWYDSEEGSLSATGAAWLLSGSDLSAALVGGALVDGEAALADVATARLFGEQAQDRAGISVAGVGDVDGDGGNDLVVGAYLGDATAYGAGEADAGVAYLWFGGAPLTGDHALVASPGLWYGGAQTTQAGVAVAGAGDMDADGLADFLVGADKASPGGLTRAGTGWLVLGAGW